MTKDVGGGVLDAPRVSRYFRVGRRAACPQAAAPVCGCGKVSVLPLYGAASSTPRGPGMPGPYDVFLPQRHVDLILDGKAVDRQLCHRYGQPLGKCAAVEP